MEGMEEWDMEGMEEWATGGAGPVIQEPVDTSNHHLDKAINKFYNWSSRPSVNNLESRYDSGFPVHLDGNNITLRN
jgi:hypothetical protein